MLIGCPRKDIAVRVPCAECDCGADELGPETVYHVRNRPGRAAVTNQTTGRTTIYPMPKPTK